jgi:type I restriction enzyme S subunit
MKLLFDVTATEYQIVRDVLATHLGDECHVWVFGSRAKNTARFNSDLDLAIECAEPLSKQALIALNEAFDEAKLAFSVDVVDLKTVEPYFKTIIDSHKVVFPLSQNVPQLRFPEFSGDWEEGVLGQLLNGISSGRSKKDDSGKYELYGSTGVIGKTFDCFYSGCFILVARVGANAGYLTKIDGEIGVTDNTLVLVPKDSQNRDFIFLLLNKFNLNKLVFGSGQPLITGGQLKGLSLLSPSLPEQTKIAAFLSVVDTKIDQLTQKKALLETYKKGVMQQIFSQQIRFTADDGGEYPEWEEKKLGELAVSHYQGINTAADKIAYHSKGFPIIQAKHITNEVLDFDDARFVCYDQFVFYKEKYRPQKGDILVSNIGTIGKVVLIEEDLNFLIAWNIFKIRLIKGINEKFISYHLKKIASEGFFDSLQAGNATKFINKSDMLGITVSNPCLEEQTKIANFLSAIDRKIDLVSQQLEQAKAFKKGLLQQMFV